MPDPFAPTLEAARQRLAAVRPAAYARTRNAIDGTVTGLSPYITHGLFSPRDVLASVEARHKLDVQHKLVFELGWREYFRHVWQHQGDGILQSLHAGPLPDDAYSTAVPADIRSGCTGVPAIDAGVRSLHATGTLHNHARMWLASYVVHLRKVHWRAGADWLYGHLLDGDLASNHLSWQWVAGSGSRKPYLFNADNVARYAPAPWHSPGSVIDASYDEMDRRARDASWVAPAGDGEQAEPMVRAEPPAELGCSAPLASAVRGREVWLVHPWNLGPLPDDLPAQTQVIGLFVADFHHHWPWSEQRWRFVGTRMEQLCQTRWYGDASAIGSALAGARSVRSIAEPHLAAWLPRWAECAAAPTLFAPVERRCDSFSQWWTRSTRGLRSAADLLAGHEAQAW